MNRGSLWYRLYLRTIRRVGISEGLWTYYPTFTMRVIRLFFFFPERVKEQLYWWGIFHMDHENKMHLNTKKNREKYG